jgi:hypothetical protein
MNNKSLVLDLVEWVAEGPRSYAEVMRAWRTSCPRLSIWEDSLEFGFVQVESRPREGLVVAVTASGAAFLLGEGRPTRRLPVLKPLTEPATSTEAVPVKT